MLEKLRQFYSDPNNMGWIIIGVILIIMVTMLVATAKTTGEKSTMSGPDETDYYETVMMPDNPLVSCCGVADVYWADTTEEGPNGQIIAVITDTRPDDRTLSDGRKISRPHVPVGSKIPVPPSKIRKKPIPNPTEHTVIWLGYGSLVYCYEPQALL